MVRLLHLHKPARACRVGSWEEGEISGSDDGEHQWESAMWDASDLGPVPQPAQPAQQQDAPRRSSVLPGRRTGHPCVGLVCIPEPEKATFSESIAQHLDTLRDSICKEHGQASSQLLKTISALQRENRDLRSMLAPSISTRQADITDLPRMLEVSATASKASSWRDKPSRVVIAEEVRIGGGDDVDNPKRCSSDSRRGSAEGPPGEEDCSKAGDVAMDSPMPMSSPQLGAVTYQATQTSDMFQYELHDIWRARHRTNHSKEALSPLDVVCSPRTNSSGTVAMSDTTPRRMVLSPSSNLYLLWQFLFTVILCYELVLFPMDVFDLPADGFLQSMAWATTVFWTCDLALTFFTGFYSQHGLYITSHRAIALNYLRTWFCMDTLVVLLDWLFVLSNGSASASFNLGKAMRLLRVTRVLRLFRLRKIREAMNHLDDFVSSMYFTCIKSIVVNMAGILVMAHFFGCFWFWVGCLDVQGYESWVDTYNMRSYGWSYRYATSLHWSITQFTPGSMHIQPQNVPERAFAVMMLVMGMVIFSSIISNVTAATNSLKRMTARYDGDLADLRRFFKQESISNDLIMRVMRYADNIIKPKMLRVDTNDVQIIKLLPRPLYMEVVLEIYDQDLEVLPFFSALKFWAPNVMAKACCQALSQVNLSQRAELFCQGDTADAVFFLVHGKAEYSFDSKNMNLEAVKAHTKSVPICEAILWTPWHMRGRMMTLSECELVQIETTIFQRVMASNQRVMPLAQRYSAEFVKGLNELICADLPISDLVDIEAAKDILGGYQPGLRLETSDSF